jgi:hypothetical protein
MSQRLRRHHLPRRHSRLGRPPRRPHARRLPSSTGSCTKASSSASTAPPTGCAPTRNEPTPSAAPPPRPGHDHRPAARLPPLRPRLHLEPPPRPAINSAATGAGPPTTATPPATPPARPARTGQPRRGDPRHDRRHPHDRRHGAGRRHHHRRPGLPALRQAHHRHHLDRPARRRGRHHAITSGDTPARSVTCTRKPSSLRLNQVGGSRRAPLGYSASAITARAAR